MSTYGIAAVSLLVLALITPAFNRGWTMTLILLALVIAGPTAEPIFARLAGLIAPS
jgi:hypothetical protein